MVSTVFAMAMLFQYHVKIGYVISRFDYTQQLNYEVCLYWISLFWLSFITKYWINKISYGDN